MAEKPPVLVVDNDPELRDFIARALHVGGYPVEACADAAGTLERLETVEVGVVVAEVFLKGVNGIELLKQVRTRFPGTEVVLLGREVPTYTVVTAMQQGAADFVEKPIDIERLTLAVERAVERVRLAHENVALKRVMDLRGGGEIVAASPLLLEVLERVDLVASSEIRVLIEGESGVGKELIANRLHRHSPRSERPFVAVNCGAIQENLLESELFGHKRGAFTGATEDHKGLFEIADGGTLFLDEIGEMSLELQVKLLRVLERNEFRPVGSNKLVRVDVRVVAATNKTLAQEVAGGRFREDLFYRLNVIHVEVPPLRDRPEDIAVLVEAFLESHRRKGLSRKRISAEAVQVLRGYPFPGNVRELRNVIERCQILTRGDEITLRDLPPNVLAASGRAPASGGGAVEFELTQTLAEVERTHVLRVYEAHDRNKVQAAKALGVNVKTLYNKLKSYAELAGEGK